MIKETIYEFYDNERLKKEGYEVSKNINFAPSYLTSCKRQLYYKKTNFPASNPIDTHSYIKFAMGDAVHEKIQSILKEIDIYIDGEGWNETEWMGLKWIYRYDGKIINCGNKSIIEIKTKYAQGIDSIERNGADKDHELQLFLYMIFENIQNGTLLYIGRDNGFMLEFNYTYDALFKEYNMILSDKIDQLKILKTQIENKELPNRDFNIVMKYTKNNLSFDFQKDNIKYKSDWHCSYCSWKNECWKNEIEEIKNNTFYINNIFIK